MTETEERFLHIKLPKVDFDAFTFTMRWKLRWALLKKATSRKLFLDSLSVAFMVFMNIRLGSWEHAARVALYNLSELLDKCFANISHRLTKPDIEALQSCVHMFTAVHWASPILATVVSKEGLGILSEKIKRRLAMEEITDF